jgi:hypothetical protein
MPEVSEWLAIVALFVLLPVLTWPEAVRALGRLATRVNNWGNARAAAREVHDVDEEQLWLVHRRRQLCVDLARLEHLIATDTWMSATRQRGNRLAYAQLLDDLRRTPDVFEPHSFDPWDATTTGDSRFVRLGGTGYTQQPSTVEVLEIGWQRHHRR